VPVCGAGPTQSELGEYDVKRLGEAEGASARDSEDWGDGAGDGMRDIGKALGARDGGVLSESVGNELGLCGIALVGAKDGSAALRLSSFGRARVG
jgi:hypothetical protein